MGVHECSDSCRRARRSARGAGRRHRRSDRAGPGSVADDLLGSRRGAREAGPGALRARDRDRPQHPLRLLHHARDRARRGGKQQPGGHLLGEGAGHARARRRPRPAEEPPAEDRRQGAVPLRDAEPPLGRDERPLARPRLQHARVTQNQLPASMWNLTDPAWKGKIGLAPTNASFQAFLGATIHMHGEARVRTWLEGLRDERRQVLPEQHADRAGSRRAVTSRSASSTTTTSTTCWPTRRTCRSGTTGSAPATRARSCSPPESASSRRRRRTPPRSASSTSCTRSGPSASSRAAPAPPSTR